MAKGYLIIDMPRNCDWCPVGSEAPWCPVAPDGADIDQQNDKTKRPDWCPLRKDFDVIDENRELKLTLSLNKAWRDSFDDELMAYQDELYDLKEGLKDMALWDKAESCLSTTMDLIDEIIEYGNT